MKKLATWLLAAAFTTAALPVFAVEPSVQVGYSPEGSARVLVLSAIDSCLLYTSDAADDNRLV